MNFQEWTVKMTKNIYANTICQPLINGIDIKEFDMTSGVPQGCNLSGVLINIAMMSLLAKLNCLPKKGMIRPYQIKAEEFLTNKG